METPVEKAALWNINTFPLISANNPILTTPCEPFDFANPPFDPIDFSKSLVKTMRDLNGIGLAAPQVGIPYQVFAIRSDPNKVFFNPKIVWVSEELEEMEEGCLSFPGLIVKVKRPKHIRIRYQQPNSEILTEKFTGMTARIIQHENDHISGILFFNKVSKLKRDMAFKKWKKK